MSVSPAFTFGKNILKTAEENGYIRPGTTPRDANDIPNVHVYSRGGDCFYCCYPPSYHQRNKDAGKECLALAAVAAAATSLVFLGYTIKAVAEGTSYHSEKTYAQEKIEGEDDPTSRAIYANAKHVLNGMENERTWTTLSLALTTFGTALLTVAAIIALVVHPHFGAYAAQIHQYCLYGGIFAGAGLILLTVTRAHYGYYSLQHEADALVKALSSTPPPYTEPSAPVDQG